MGLDLNNWFGSRSRAERVELRKARKKQKREAEIERLRGETELYTARARHKRAKRAARGEPRRPLFSVTIEKKKQGRRLSRKQRIRLL